MACDLGSPSQERLKGAAFLYWLPDHIAGRHDLLRASQSLNKNNQRSVCSPPYHQHIPAGLYPTALQGRLRVARRPGVAFRWPSGERRQEQVSGGRESWWRMNDLSIRLHQLDFAR